MSMTCGPKGKSCYQLRIVVSKPSHGFVVFPELPLGMAGMLVGVLTTDSGNESLSKVL